MSALFKTIVPKNFSHYFKVALFKVALIKVLLYTLAININFEKFNVEVKSNLKITENFQQHERPHLRVELGSLLEVRAHPLLLGLTLQPPNSVVG